MSTTSAALMASFPCRCGAQRAGEGTLEQRLADLDVIATMSGAVERLCARVAWASDLHDQTVAFMLAHCVCPDRPDKTLAGGGRND